MMLNFKEIQQSRQKAEINTEKYEHTSENLFAEAMSQIKNFNCIPGFNYKYLQEAARLLAEVIKFKKANPEPYFYLAYIFYLMERNDLSLKYYKIAYSIRPDLPGLSKLRALLSEGTGNLEYNQRLKATTSLGAKIGNLGNKSPKGAPVSITPGNTGSLILSTEFNSGINPGPKEFGGNLIRGILNTNKLPEIVRTEKLSMKKVLEKDNSEITKSNNINAKETGYLEFTGDIKTKTTLGSKFKKLF